MKGRKQKGWKIKLTADPAWSNSQLYNRKQRSKKAYSDQLCLNCIKAPVTWKPVVLNYLFSLTSKWLQAVTRSQKECCSRLLFVWWAFLWGINTFVPQVFLLLFKFPLYHPVFVSPYINAMISIPYIQKRIVPFSFINYKVLAKH